MLRPRLQRLVDRFNASPWTPVVIEDVVLARQGRLGRWELRVRTIKRQFSPVRIPLSPWRWQKPAYGSRAGAKVLPFEHPGGSAAAREAARAAAWRAADARESVRRMRLADLHDRLSG